MHLMMWCACEEKAKQTGNKQTTRKESIEGSGRVLERPGEIWKDLERWVEEISGELSGRDMRRYGEDWKGFGMIWIYLGEFWTLQDDLNLKGSD